MRKSSQGGYDGWLAGHADAASTHTLQAPPTKRQLLVRQIERLGVKSWEDILPKPLR